MKKNLLHPLLSLLLLLNLCGPARAATPPPAPGRSLAEALNPDGTLKAGLNGSFDAHAFRMGTAPDGRPVFRPAGVAGSGDERWQDGFGLPNGASDVVRAVVQSGTDIYIGGDFKAVGNVPARGVAKWNGTAWSSLGTGTANGTGGAYTLAVAPNGDVYVGGTFTQGGGVGARGVARWNGTAWSTLDTGISNGAYVGGVYALAVASNGDVYAGGAFTQAGGAVANNVAKWNGTAWSSLGTGTGTANGVSSDVYALAVAGNGDVYAGGAFTQAGGATANRVAKWNGTAWSSLGTGTGTANGVSSDVYALAVAGNGDVYVGGRFTQAGGATANRVAKWNGTAWSSLGTGPANGVGDDVNALAVAGNGDVYVGGRFTQAGGATANRVAKWNGTAWSSLGTGPANGVGDDVNALAVATNGDVHTGGDFIQAGGATANRIARWNGTAWNSLDTGTANGVGGFVFALAVAGNGDVYVGGTFLQAGGVAANRVARWNGAAWSSLGTGTANGVNSDVFTLAIGSNGDVYVGGSFTQAGGATANGIAHWNGTAWNSLGTGTANGVGGGVYALAIGSNGDVYVGGGFTQAGGVAANRVARWNGTAWSSLGTGTANGISGGLVFALAVAGNGDVYVGGTFTQAGGATANRVARWNGTAWSSLGTGAANGVSGDVNALVVAGNGNVYIGGDFTRAGGVAANYVARWNGTAWSTLGTGTANGVSYSVLALTVASNGDLYVGGYFTQAGGAVANAVARWNGTAWNGLGTGTDFYVIVLAVGPTDKLYAGGTFATTGDGGKVMAHFGIYDSNAVLATKASAATPAAQLFPNPAHGTATLRLPACIPRQPLTLTDALGRTVRRYPAPAASDVELDLRGLPAGVYSVRCGQLSQRLVVE
ncbi:hypothetical protein GCM10028822_30440 [Hymenobacter terrigena]